MGGCCSFCSVAAKQRQKRFVQSPATTRSGATGSDGTRALPQSKPLASPSPLPPGRVAEASAAAGRPAALAEGEQDASVASPLLGQTASQLPANTVSTLGTTLTLNLTLNAAPNAMKMPIAASAVDRLGQAAGSMSGGGGTGPASGAVPPAPRRPPHRGSCASNVTVEDLITDTLQVSASTVTEPHETVESDDITATSYVDVSQPTQSLLVDRVLHTHEAPMRTLSDMDATSDFDYTLPETYDPSRVGYARRERERHVASHETESRARIARLMYLTWRALLARFYRELFTIERLDMLQHFFLERCALLLRITAVDEKRRRGWLEKEAAAQRAALFARLVAGRAAIAQAARPASHAPHHRRQPLLRTTPDALPALVRSVSEPVEEDAAGPHSARLPHHRHHHRRPPTRGAGDKEEEDEDNNYVDLDADYDDDVEDEEVEEEEEEDAEGEEEDREEEGEVDEAVAGGEDDDAEDDIFSPRSPSAQGLASRANSPGRPSTAPAGPPPPCLTEGSSASNEHSIASPRNRNAPRERSSSHLTMRTGTGYGAKLSSRDSSSLRTSHDTLRTGHEMDTSG